MTFTSGRKVLTASRPAALRGILAAALLTAPLLLSACTDSEPTDESKASADTGLTVEDAWVKTADKGMTAVFATLNNSGDTDIAVKSATCELSTMELHEMAMSDGEMVMRQMKDGVTVPANGGHTLEPGGDHLMLMDISEPIQAGDEITVTLSFNGDESLSFTAVAKDFAGGNEEYDGDSTDKDN